MRTHTRKSGPLAAVAVVAASLVLLAACTGNPGGSTPSGTGSVAPAVSAGPDSASATSSASPTTSAASTESPTASPASTVPQSSTAAASENPTANATTATPGASEVAVVQPCTTAVLAASVAGPPEESVGTYTPNLVLTNTGGTTCTLWGYPGVSFVGHGNGTQLGPAGERVDLASRQLVTLEPGESAHSTLRILNSGRYPQAMCQSEIADGFRIYPPDQVSALFAPADYTTCVGASISFLMVGPMEPGES